MRIENGLENRLNIGVNGNVRLRKPVDPIVGASGALKMKKAADVVILVKGAENAFDFLPRKSQRIERHGFSVAAGDSEIFLNDFLQFQGATPQRRATQPAFLSGIVADSGLRRAGQAGGAQRGCDHHPARLSR